jgi:hypothetical protein
MTRRFFALLSITCFCFAAGAGVSFAIDRLTADPPDWCAAACARWQMAECTEGGDVCIDSTCLHRVSCLAACESWPHSYPTGQCVADPPAGAGPMQTCEEIKNTCG